MTEYIRIYENVTPFLDTVRERLHDERPTLAKLVPLVRRYFEVQFETEGAYGGQAWAPLTPATLERRHSFRPLMLTGALWASLTQEGSRYSYAYLSPDSVRVGTRDPVAHLLEGGTRKMQARDIEGDPPPHEVERYADIIGDDLLA
jgi:hypothetical protein